MKQTMLALACGLAAGAGLMIPTSALANEPGYYYGYFFADGHGKLRPDKQYFSGRVGCWDASCPIYNPITNRTFIHTPIIETRHRGGGGLQGDWAFCRQLKTFMTLEAFENRGMTCHVYTVEFPTLAAARAALDKQIANARRKTPGITDVTVAEFTTFKPENFGRFRIMPFGSDPLPRGAETATTRTAAPASAPGGGSAATPRPATTPARAAPVLPVAAPLPPSQTGNLNARQAAAAAKQDKAIVDAQAAYAAEVKRVADETARIEREAAQARADHAARLAEHQREVELIHRQNAEARAQWEADVAACKAGDRARCARR